MASTAEEAAARWRQVEAELLAGQKMQGLSTCMHVHAVLAAARLPQQLLGDTSTAPGAASTLQHARYVRDPGRAQPLPGALPLFPLLHAIHEISTGALSPASLFEVI